MVGRAGGSGMVCRYWLAMIITDSYRQWKTISKSVDE